MNYKSTLWLVMTFLPFITLSQDHDRKIPVNEEVRIGKLDNGLTYYIRKNTTPRDRAELRLVLNAGSLQEDEDQQGLAHFTEHMLFNGTKHFEKNDLIDFFELNGMKFGAHVNAYTSFGETVYMLKPRTDSQAIFDQSFQVLEDWAHLASLDGEEIDKERGVVIEEWRLRLGPENRMMTEYLPVLFYQSHYADRLPIGKKEVLDNFEHEELRRFYRDWYRPDLMAVIAVGDFDVNEVEEKIKQHFSHLTNPENAPERKSYELPDHDEPLVKVVTDPEASFTNVRIYYKHPPKESVTIRDYRQHLLGNLYRIMLSNRYDEIRQQEDPPFVYAYGGYQSLTRTKDAYVSSAMMGDDNIEEGMRALVQENQRILLHGFTESELERAKKELLTRIKSQFNERDKMKSNSIIREYIGNFLYDEPIPGITWEYEMHRELLPEVRIEEINELGESWITDHNVVIIVTAPEKEGIETPGEEQVLEIYKEVKHLPVEAYEDEEISEILVDKVPQAAKIVEVREKEETGITILTFENGATVWLKPTDFKNDEILLSAYSPGGHSIYPDKDYFSAFYADDVISESGLGKFPSTALEKFLSGKDVSVRPYIGSLSEGFSGNASPEELETLLQLIYLNFTWPRNDLSAFNSYVQKQKMVYQNLMANPRFYFSREVSRVLSQNHLRSGFPDVEDLDKIDHNQAYEIFRERFSNAGDFTFFLVGNFEIERIKPLLSRYIGGLPSTGEEESWEDRGIEYPEGMVTHEVFKGKEPQSMVNITFTGDFDWEYDKRLELMALTKVLNIKLREQMREEQGGVYGVGVYGNTSKFPDEEYSITIRFGCDPDNVDTLVKTVEAEIRKLQENGAQEVDLKKVKRTEITTWETDLRENRNWLRRMETAYERGEEVNTWLYYDENLQELTTEDIQEAANEYFDLENYIRVVLYPEKDTEPETEGSN